MVAEMPQSAIGIRPRVLYGHLNVFNLRSIKMTKFLVALSATALIASATVASAGGLSEPVPDNTVVPAGPSSSLPLWAVLGGVIVAGAVLSAGGSTD
jgi:hypothetical protein